MINTTTLKITPKFLNFIAEIDEFKGSWKVLGNIAPERLSALRRVATIESVGSSTRIEGSILSDREVEQILNNIKIKSFSMRDEQEVAGYSYIMEQIFQSWEAIPLSENYICQLHRDLLRYSDKDERHRGSYKHNKNSVAAFDENGRQIGIVFETATPFDTPRLMTELVEWTNKALETKELHPLLVIGIFIVSFLAIHPFQDGNGRLSRILTTLLLLRSGYTYTPYSSLESVIENSKQRYYLALRKTQQTLRSDSPDWQPWLLYFLQALLQQIQRLQKKMEREHMLRIQLPALSFKILEFVRNHDHVTISELVKQTGQNRNTVKKHLSNLVGCNYLCISGKGRGTWYTVK